jgi:hypothetical protein
MLIFEAKIYEVSHGKMKGYLQTPFKNLETELLANDGILKDLQKN